MWPKGGWYKEIDCSTAWDFTNDTVTGNTTLYAKWTLQTYNITYLDENGANFTGTHASEHPTTHTYGTATTLKGATRTGYAFGGWFTTSDCSGTAITSLGATSYTDNISLYAQWTGKEYTITYKDQGGTDFSGTHGSGYPTKHTYGAATTLKGATRTGYAFGGWFTTSDCSGTAITSLEATVYTSDITLYAKWVVLPDALSGVFTVNAEGKTVHFSKGNLQATIDKDGKPTAWKFAANQYVCLGKDGANESIGTAGGDIDLFGWSTETTNYGISTSDNASDYSGDFKDWGKAIGDGNTWHTLSKAEWMYLLNTRTVNGDTGEGYSYQNAIINSDATGVYGMILYPDDYTEQTTATRYTSAEWLAMEAAGAVFLPAAGNRYGSSVNSVGGNGDYWSSTPSEVSPDGAYKLYFVDSFVDPAGSDMRGLGYSVRLVLVAEN